MLRRPLWQLWGPVLAVVAGSLIGGLGFGIYDAASVREASWIGMPPLVYPGLDLGFGPEFWVLLPAFVLVTVVGAMDTLGDGVAIQRVSWRRPRAVDFRAIQGALSADGLGNLLAGLAGTLPNTTRATGISIVEFIAATDEANLQDQMAALSEQAAGGRLEREVSLRLLRHYASSVRHSQYHDTDVITVRVEAAGPTR